MFKLDLEKAENQRSNCHIRWIIEKAREFQENICIFDYAKAFDCVDLNKLWKILKEMGIPDHISSSWEIYMQGKKQQLKPDMEQQTSSKLGKIPLSICHEVMGPDATILVFWMLCFKPSFSLFLCHFHQEPL